MAKKSFSGQYGEGGWRGQRLFLLKPQTFMNLSGRSVAEALRYHKLPLAELIVVHDDLDIPFGRVKLKEGGGHGGHNGLRSLVQELGSADFVRLRIGIGRPARGDVADYVLNNFPPDQLRELAPLCDGALNALALLLDEGLAKAMSLYNNKDVLVESLGSSR